jgi:hypothetical protein
MHPPDGPQDVHITVIVDAVDKATKVVPCSGPNCVIVMIYLLYGINNSVVRQQRGVLSSR